MAASSEKVNGNGKLRWMYVSNTVLDIVACLLLLLLLLLQVSILSSLHVQQQQQ